MSKVLARSTVASFCQSHSPVFANFLPNSVFSFADKTAGAKQTLAFCYGAKS